MVEKSNNAPTQLPVFSATDISKNGSYMYGSIEQFAATIKEQLKEVPLNPLEEGLLDRFLANP